MEIAIIQDDQVVEIGHYKRIFPNTSFPTTGPDADFMTANNALGVTIWKTHDKTTQKLVNCQPYIEDDQVFTVEVAEKTEEELAAAMAAESAIVREKRNSLLTASDWTQVADAPLTTEVKAIWATYRQALRDVTTQETFPYNIVWPEVE